MDTNLIFFFVVCCFVTTVLCSITGPGANVCSRSVTQKVGNITKPKTEYYCCKGYEERTSGTCVKCLDNKYGDKCSQTCTCVSANTASCDNVNGTCTCKPGWVQATCNQKCSQGKYGKDCTMNCNCQSSTTQSCRTTDGTCVCKPGYQGNKCQSKCAEGKYGSHCSQSCKCSTTGTSNCHHITGSCSCKPGYIGNRCHEKCPNMKFGDNCSKTCTCNQDNTLNCHHVNGVCNCMAGYTGGQCQNVCTDGTFGNKCSSNCTCPMNAYQVCDAANGKCICKSGWSGTTCSDACRDGTFGSYCLGRCEGCSTCNSDTGKCLAIADKGSLIAIIILAVLLAVVVVVFIFFIIRIKRGDGIALFSSKENVPKPKTRKTSKKLALEPQSPQIYYNATDMTYENTTPNGKATKDVRYEPVNILPQTEYENFTGKGMIEKDGPSEDKYESLEAKSPEHAYEMFSGKSEDDQHHYSALTGQKSH